MLKIIIKDISYIPNDTCFYSVLINMMNLLKNEIIKPYYILKNDWDDFKLFIKCLEKSKDKTLLLLNEFFNNIDNIYYYNDYLHVKNIDECKKYSMFILKYIEYDL